MKFRGSGCYWSTGQFRNRGIKMLGSFLPNFWLSYKHSPLGTRSRHCHAIKWFLAKSCSIHFHKSVSMGVRSRGTSECHVIALNWLPNIVTVRTIGGSVHSNRRRVPGRPS